MSGGAEQVLLMVCGDNQEASVVRSLLESHDIDCVIQGEQHRSMLGMVGAIIEVRVLVAARDLEQAKALLEADAQPEGENGVAQGSGASAGDGAVCAVHEQPSTLTCTRCGAFLCDACKVLDRANPLCEDCDERLLPTPEQRVASRRRKGLIVLAILVGPGLLMMIFVLLRALFAR